MADYKLMAKQIIDEVGGSSNIVGVTHCATRLRFEIKDINIINKESVEKINGVLAVVARGDKSFQVVIGGAVATVYDEINSLPEMSSDDDSESSGTKTDAEIKAENRAKIKGKFRIVDSFFEFLSDSFRPIISVLVSASIILAILNLIVAIPWIPINNVTDTPTTMFFNAMAMAVFKFLPVLVAYNAFKKLKIKPMVGAIVMLTLFTPQFLALGNPELYGDLWKDAAGNLNETGFQNALSSLSVYTNEVLQKNITITNILGIDTAIYDYSSSVLLPLLIAGIAALLDRVLKKIIPAILQFVCIPFIEIVLLTILAVMVIGPISIYLGNFLGEGLAWLNWNIPMLFAILIPLMYPFLVPLGLHWPINAIILLNISQNGYDFIQGPMGCWNFACFGATLGVLLIALREKNKGMISISSGALIAGLVGGISEPSLYGIHLRYKKLYPRMLAGCAVGGIVIGVLGWLFPSTFPGAVGGVTVNAFAYQSLLTIPLFNQTWVFVVSIAVSFIIPAILIFIFDYRTEEQKIADKQLA